MADYGTLSVEDLRAMMVAEADRHAPMLDAAAAMWKSARAWLSSQAQLLRAMQRDLGESWRDLAGTVFDETLTGIISVTESWTDEGMTDPESGKPSATGVTTDDLTTGIDSLAQGIRNVRREADGEVEKLSANASDKDRADARDVVASKMNSLIPYYDNVATRMHIAIGRPMTDVPLVAVPSSATDGPPGPAAAPTAGGGGDPSSVDPQDAPGAQDPANAQGPDKAKDGSQESPLVTAKNAVDVASKLVDLAKNAASSGASQIPDPASLAGSTFDPSDLLNTADSPLGSVPDSGLPGLASSGGGGLGGSTGALSGLGSISSGGLPVSGSISGSASSAIPAVMGSSTAAGSTGVGGIPPMYPPQTGAGRGSSGGVRSGAAEQVNAVKSRKPDEKAGVVLPGRDGQGKEGRNRKGKGTPAQQALSQAPKPRPVTEGEPVLDEDLWRVKATETSYRT
ncbi:hypothetical protein [Amycolatopsis taiwanensis]|uniref:hypothetical protein n=1 Tax=Amycolatopsis taiwanensis TaxID=342230 RepID=UPI000485EA83|nr:hypothetical protein [Amycolatopsis taiwanensis]